MQVITLATKIRRILIMLVYSFAMVFSAHEIQATEKVDQLRQLLQSSAIEQNKNIAKNRPEISRKISQLDEYGILMAPEKVEITSDGRGKISYYIIHYGSEEQNISKAKGAYSIVLMNDNPFSKLCTPKNIETMSAVGMFVRDIVLTKNKEVVAEHLYNENTCKTYLDCVEQHPPLISTNPLCAPNYLPNAEK